MLGKYKGYNSVKYFCSKIKETFLGHIIKFDQKECLPTSVNSDRRGSSLMLI